MNYLILAAGIGSRLNNQKYYLKINGYTLLEHVYKKIDPSNNIFVVYKDEKVREIHNHLNVKWLKNESLDVDKDISIRIGLNEINDKCILLLADMPNYSKENFKKLSGNQSIFSYNNKVNLPPVYIVDLDVKKYLSANKTLKQSIDKYTQIEYDNNELKDIDTMEDVVEVRKNIVVLSDGNLASNTINLLVKNGFNVHILELDKDSIDKKSNSYSKAMSNKVKETDDVVCIKTDNFDEYYNAKLNSYATISNQEVFNNLDLKIDCLIDITLNNKNVSYLNENYLSIGVGPGFIAKKDVNYVIENPQEESIENNIIDINKFSDKSLKIGSSILKICKEL